MENIRSEFVVTEEDVNERLDKALARHPLIATRSQAAQLIQKGCILKEGRPLKTSYRVSLGEYFELFLPVPNSKKLEKLNSDLHIYYEDEDLLVIEKPSGLVVHPSPGHEQDTLVNVLLHHCSQLSKGFAKDRPGIIHRLDKDTSGILVVAKNDPAQEGLARQFKDRSVKRAYWALVHGHPKNEAGTITSYLIRHPRDRKKYTSYHPSLSTEPTKGKRAVTHFKCIDVHTGHFTLVECRLETGRTHQIRVHMREMGHPILGDRLYGHAKQPINKRLKPLINPMDRIALHAYLLGFRHPLSGKELSFSSPCPQNLKSIIEEFGWTSKILILEKC